MQLTPNEILSVEDAGMLDNSAVKLVRTRGGFWIAVGRPKGKLQDEALAAGSHPAIVKFNLERQHPGFQPSMMKSELVDGVAKVEKHSHFLSDTLRKSGHDVYSIEHVGHVEFQITKQNAKVASAVGNWINQELVFDTLDVDKKFTRALAGATSEKAVSMGAKKIRVK